ncbi:MAG: hypothetical protein AAB370_08450, partial [Verrucomicrobiota bacterium]
MAVRPAWHHGSLLLSCAMLAAPFIHSFEAGLALFYPRVCQLCEQERATPEQGFVCAKCWTGVR